VTKHIKPNSDDEQVVVELKSVILHLLSPVVRPLLSCVHNLGATSTGIEKCGMGLVMNQLVFLE